MRSQLRAKLEHAVAHWEAKNERPLVYARNPQYIYTDDQEGWFGTDSIWEFLKKQFNPEKFGYEQVDAIHYYTEKLQRYNREVTKLQKKYSDSVANADEGLQRKFKSRQDTRVAAFVETIGTPCFPSSNILIVLLPGATTPVVLTRSDVGQVPRLWA